MGWCWCHPFMEFQGVSLGHPRVARMHRNDLLHFCCNTFGTEQSKPLVAGKSLKPRFKNVNSLPRENCANR